VRTSSSEDGLLHASRTAALPLGTGKGHTVGGESSIHGPELSVCGMRCQGRGEVGRHRTTMISTTKPIAFSRSRSLLSFFSRVATIMSFYCGTDEQERAIRASMWTSITWTFAHFRGIRSRPASSLSTCFLASKLANAWDNCSRRLEARYRLCLPILADCRQLTGLAESLESATGVDRKSTKGDCGTC
jgi:hypothetical protein